MDSYTELKRFGILLTAALVGGLLTGAFGWCFFIASLAWSFMQYTQFKRIGVWAQKPITPPRNISGSWLSLVQKPHETLIRERERTKTILNRVREALLVIELIPDAVIVIDQDGVLESFNSAAKRLFNLKRRDVGLGFTSIVRSPELAQLLRDAHPEESMEFSSPFKAEQYLEVRCVSAASNRRLLLVRDVSSLNRQQTIRQHFVANVSHELRTPLTVAAGYMEALTDDTTTNELRLSLVDKLRGPIQRMQALVEDLLLLAQLERSPDLFEPQRISMPRVIEQAKEEIASLATSRSQIQIRCDSSREILGSERELLSVCVNLLSNAIRYSKDDAPIEISWTNRGEYVRLTVVDSGYGIAEEHIPRLTERFFRIDATRSRAKGGTGLGLAIVKHILVRHNSELRIKSKLNQGSTFFCDFVPVGPEHSATELNHEA